MMMQSDSSIGSSFKTRTFHTVVPYLKLLLTNSLVAEIDDDVIRYQTTSKDADEFQVKISPP